MTNIFSKMQIEQWIFLGIILLAAFLRLFTLHVVPPSPSLDEVSIGYNAYSILHTAKDEYGNTLPLLLRAYDDYRPALYVYLVIPFVFLFGLTDEAVRFPAAIFSLISVLTFFFLVKELFQRDISVSQMKISVTYVALTSMLFLALSPWHVYLSRLGHEVNIGFAFYMLAILFCLKSINNKKNSSLLIFSSLFFALSFYTYQSYRVIVPVTIIIVAAVFWRRFLEIKREAIISILLGVIVTVPMAITLLSPESVIRYKATFDLAGHNSAYYASAIRLAKAKEHNDLFGQLFNNRRITTTKIFFNNYLSHFNPNWLFRNLYNDYHKTPGLGLFYPWEALLIPIGAWVFFRQKLYWRMKVFLTLWMLSAPLAASITTDAPHAMRSFTMLTPLLLFSALGFLSLYMLFYRRWLKSIVRALLVTIFVASIIYFFKQYFLVFPREQSHLFQYALPSAMKFVGEQKDNYSRVVVSNKFHLYQSYMFHLYFSKYNPQKYIENGGTKSGGFAQKHTIENIEFRPIDFANEDDGVLLIGNRDDFPDIIVPKQEFKLRNGDPVIVAAEK